MMLSMKESAKNANMWDHLSIANIRFIVEFISTTEGQCSSWQPLNRGRISSLLVEHLALELKTEPCSKNSKMLQADSSAQNIMDWEFNSFCCSPSLFIPRDRVPMEKRKQRISLCCHFHNIISTEDFLSVYMNLFSRPWWSIQTPLRIPLEPHLSYEIDTWLFRLILQPTGGIITSWC